MGRLRTALTFTVAALCVGPSAFAQHAASPVASGTARITIACPNPGFDTCSSPEPDWARPAAFSDVRGPDGSIGGQLAIHSPGELDFGVVRFEFFANVHVKLDCAEPIGANAIILSGEIDRLEIHVWEWRSDSSGPIHTVEKPPLGGDHAVFIVEDGAEDRVSEVMFCGDLLARGAYEGPCEQICKSVDPGIDELALVPLSTGNVTVWE
jgi:hypothetical protein